MGDPDEELLSRVATGEPAAVRALVARKLPRLLSLAGRMLGDGPEAEDVAQEAFLRVWKQAPKWRPGAARFDTWLHRVALNLCYDRLRRRRELAYADPPERPDEGPAPDRGLLAMDTGRRVEAAMAALPDRQREAIVLCHYQELGNIEAAAVMGVSVEALESLLGRGRRALRAALGDLRDGRMTPERFETLAEAFGGDVAVWPMAEREAAAAFMAAEPARAGAILAEAEALDSALAAFSPPRAATGLMDRIVASAPRPRAARWWSGWLAPAGMGAGLAAACAAGVVLGARMSAPTVAPDDALITAVSDDDVGFDFDEEA